MRALFQTHQWALNGALSAILIAVVARAADLIGTGPMLVTFLATVAALTFAIVPRELERRRADVSRHLALRRLRECAGVLMHGAAQFSGKVERPAEWGAGPPMGIADLARAVREGQAIWYTGRELATVGGWADAVRRASTTFSGCAQVLMPDLIHDDRELLRDAHSAANEVLKLLEKLADTWGWIESSRRAVAENRGSRKTLVEYPPREHYIAIVTETYNKLGPALQLLHDRLVEIAHRAG